MYQCFVKEGLVSGSVRNEIAKEITQIHCQATGVPPAFVRAMFIDLPYGTSFTAGEPSETSIINGKIRAGRPLEARQQMIAELAEMWKRLTGQSEHELVIALEELASDTILEEGLIMPNPGEETDWFMRNYQHLAALGVF
ncbi:MAG TPA: tautomerase family protein [Solirubrobacteraceae bacterium]|nr:tautomerase family protein [Solirubrobacteraceae bacterium]